MLFFLPPLEMLSVFEVLTGLYYIHIIAFPAQLPTRSVNRHCVDAMTVRGNERMYLNPRPVIYIPIEQMR